MNILEMTNKEIIDWFSKEINNATATDPRPTYQHLLEEYKQKIENDFNEEWSKQPLKWLFKNRRQRKLRSKIMRRYAHPLFSVVEDCLEEMWPKMTSEFIENLVSIEDVVLGDPDFFVEED